MQSLIWSNVEAMFAGPAVSAFQKAIRGGAGVLQDHICKEMNGLNLERCRCIPKNAPGADWRVLQEIVAADPSREKFQVWPAGNYCLGDPSGLLVCPSTHPGRRFGTCMGA